MDREYFYLEEKEQKGPFTVSQLKTVGLKPNTLVWTDGFDNWKLVKDVEELKELLKKTPPPPPIIDNLPSSIIQPIEEKREEKEILFKNSNVKFWASFKIFGMALLLIGFTAFSAYFISNNKKQKLKKEICDKIDNVFDGKTVILDGTYTQTHGELRETGYSKSKQKEDPLAVLWQAWWERQKLYTIYEATSGGFTIKKLTRQNDDSFEVVIYSSGDMGYKEPVHSYVEPEYYTNLWGEREKIYGGYYSSNYRMPVSQCYTKAFEYFTTDDKYSPGAYTPGKFIDITNFSDIANEYFHLDSVNQKQDSLSDDFLSSAFLEVYNKHSDNIGNGYWAVYYTTLKKHYEIAESETVIKKDFFTYSGILVGSTILLLLILLFSKPKYFRNLKLFGKRWKNILDQEQVFFFEHSFFRKQTFVEIINDEVYKGVLKFTDKGNTINLSYPNKELFYKIEKIKRDSLSLISMKDKSNIIFIRIGAKEIEESNAENNMNEEFTQNEHIN